MSKSKIEWTDATINPVVGCTKVSPACENCYAETMAKRLAAMAEADYSKGKKLDGKTKYRDVIEHGKWNGEISADAPAMLKPLYWKKPRRIFVVSMGDLFHEKVPFDYIAAMFGVMAACPQHTFQVLTKRPKTMRLFFNYIKCESIEAEESGSVICRRKMLKFIYPDAGWNAAHSPDLPWPLPNVWLGTTVENQTCADERIPPLLDTPAAVRFVSCEPLLGPIDLCRRFKYPICKEWLAAGGDPNVYGKYHWRKQALYSVDWKGLDWVIAGGESGPGARPMDPDWIRDLRDQCTTARVPFLFKQWGAWHGAKSNAAGCDSYAKKGGRTLDGKLHDAYPTTETETEETTDES